MSRLPVSIVVTASGSLDDFHASLECLRPTLGIRDEVVCVVPTDRADLRDELNGRTWLTVLDVESADPATRWAAGCAATRHSLIVFLDGDVLVSPHWLDPVVEALTEPGVVAAGPRCHLTIGPQGVDLPDEALVNVPAFKSYARQWRQEHTGSFSEVDRLGPVCAAFRRDALSRVGGPTLDMPYEQLRRKGRIVVAHSALVAHVGSEQCSLRVPDISTDAPLLSASLIVKDEEEILAECLTALRDFVDEIVVYDTGSTDRSREIAREHGARVIEGYWNDHFGDARNRSIENCTGQWVVVVDADEIMTGDPAQVRAALATADRPALLAEVESLTGHGTATYGRMLSVRFFRPNRGRYIRRLHEQVSDRIVGRPVRSVPLPGVSLRHSGYTTVRATVKNKGERNLRLAELSVEDSTAGGHHLIDLARSQLMAGKVEEAFETCQEGLATSTEAVVRLGFLRPLIHACEALGKLDVARAAIAEIRQLSSAAVADEFEARIRYKDGDLEGALAAVRAFPESVMDDQFTFISRDRLAEIEILSLFRLQRHREAAERLRECVRAQTLPLNLPQMAAVLKAAGSGIDELADLVPAPALRALLFLTTEAPVDQVDEVLEALWQRHAGSAALLAAAARLGGGLPVMRAMEWAARLRQHGFSEHCTLLALAANETRRSRDRVLATAIALELFSDERAMPLLEKTLEAVPDDETDAVLDELRLLAPGIAAAIAPAAAG
ncbi:glycosyltransferase [Planosporangium flavigriseum]|uniref:Glycosyltransferase 2-like domain-containing protein n=1 Tax=Planosporangium flavigriseum TaxID=373681 RepID=A0A8J3LP22_9ACTN|nr:glycosyltransferase [Planosporangium flavigriseum]NJC66354.1 glycosyltransferase [Planosporangium flavigriseum]GIG74240.1 hypothetical protein Pfl04_26440 [Planosporangium flavigriseum]